MFILDVINHDWLTESTKINQKYMKIIIKYYNYKVQFIF